MFTGELAFYDLLSELVTAVNARLATTSQGSPDRVCVVNGAIAWDDCECGQLAGTIVQWFFSDDFPRDAQPGVSATIATACDSPWVVAEMVVSILRCAPQPQGDDLAPSCAQLDGSAQETISDAHHTRNVIACGLQDMKDEERIVDYIVSSQVMVGPEGMCVGSDITFLVALDRTDQ